VQELRAAVIGLGFGRRHIQAYQRLPGVRVVALVAQNADRLEQARREYDIPAAYTDDALLYEREALDLVSICTPDRLHAEQALRALRAGVHVLCEKPIAVRAEEAHALVQAVRQTGLAFMAGHNYRFVPQFAQLKALVEAGTVGDLLLGESSYVQDLYEMQARGPGYWRWADPQDFYLGGAIHNVDLLRWTLGEVREVHSFATRGMPFYPLDDTYVSNLLFENGCIGRLLLVLGARLKAKFRFDLAVYGSQGSLAARLGRSEVVQNVDALPGETPAVLPVEGSDALDLEIAHWVACVRRGETPAVDVVEGAKAVDVCLAAIRSAREGRPVAIDQEFS
jgi:UDP-N-acetylglucosamine 3-dehydrogenase